MNFPAANHLLIADPFLKDENFKRTVVFLCSHDEEGSFGLTLNRPFHHTLNQLMDDIQILDIPVNIGGPVGIDSIHFLHRLPDLVPNAEKLSADLGWGGDFEWVKKRLNDREISKKDFRFFVGYSGWSAGQLEMEMKEKTWLVAPSSHHILFESEADFCWKNSIMLLGEGFEPVIHYPLDPQLN
jgi:putative transcriptional regulator